VIRVDASPTPAEPVQHRAISRRRLLMLGGTAAGAALVANTVANTRGRGFALLPNSSFAPSTSSATYVPTFARFAFSGDPSAPGTERWQWQGLQGDLKRPAAELVANQLLYATAVQRSSDPAGITQCLLPRNVASSWRLRDHQGRLVQRDHDDDTALDVGEPAFQQAAAQFLLAKCREQRWSGVLHDEINADFQFGWPGAVPAAYPTPGDWQTAQLRYVRVLARRLNEAGFVLAGNLGTVTRDARSWSEQLVAAGMTAVSEFFVTGNADGGTMASAENGQWQEQIDWAEWNLAQRRTVVLHERQSAEAPIRYGLATFLLVDTGTGVFGADVDYDATTTPYPKCFTDAARLGPPTDRRLELNGGLWSRQFRNGLVLVNSNEHAMTWHGTELSPTSAAITVHR